MEHYLADSGDLYRQYLRFMIENRWLLSCLMPIRKYPAIVGCDLNIEGKWDKSNTGRANQKVFEQRYIRGVEKSL